MSWKLKRTKQCAKCPWKKVTDPHQIPNGYCEEQHKALADTIAVPASLDFTSPKKVMACHESPVGEEAHCIGWLMHQLGPGNNIAMRLKMLSCENRNEIELVGEQHDRFEDTLPPCS